MPELSPPGVVRAELRLSEAAERQRVLAIAVSLQAESLYPGRPVWFVVQPVAEPVPRFGRADPAGRSP